ncbi:MAG: hypothetical protein GY795_12575 [Desulfobacterales bacterium]|nr:hypothetical protein [Desulfobacterales bacterium]
MPGRKYFFSKMIGLSKGENIITLWGADISGNSVIKTIKVIRKIPAFQDTGARLKVAVALFRRTENREILSHGFENNLTEGMRKRRRFQADLKLGLNTIGNEEEILKKAQETFDCVLFGSVKEQDSNMSVEIYARMVDTETKTMLTSVDVYDENVDTDVLKKLSAGTEMKLTDELPVVEGMVEKISTGRREIDIDLGRESKIKKGMKLIVYQDLKESGRARLEIIGEKKSVAILDKKNNSVKLFQRVITR